MSDIAGAFRDNLRAVVDLIALPYVLLLIGSREILRLTAYTLALIQTQLYMKYNRHTFSNEEQAILEKTARAVMEEIEAREGHKDAESTQMDAALARVYSSKEGESGIQALLQAGLVRAWSSLESLAEDLWEFSLNTGVNRLGVASAERVLADQELQKQRVDGLLAQAIQVHLLARHDWNIKGKLGTLLKRKCDFTSVQGINRGFGVLFRDQTVVPQLRDTQELRQIELLRHLIVHRAGIVDEEYRTASKRNIEIGERVELTGGEVADAFKLVLNEGRNLLTSVEAALGAVREAP